MANRAKVSLRLSRHELQKELKEFKRFTGQKNAGEAILSHQPGWLRIQLSGVAVRLPASGTWDGEARMAGQLLSKLWQSLPPGDPVSISVDGDRLKIGSLSLPCVWQEKRPIRIQLPLDAPLSAILRLPSMYTEDEISSSGLTDVLEKAQKRRDQLLKRAAKTLEPLGITRDDLSQFVQAHLLGSQTG